VFLVFDTSFYSLYKTDADAVALLEIRVAVILILNLHFCWKYICVFVACFLRFHNTAPELVKLSTLAVQILTP